MAWRIQGWGGGTGRKFRRSFTDLPLSFVAIPLRGAVRVIPERVYVAGIRRGQMLRRRAERDRLGLQKNHERRGGPALIGACALNRVTRTRR